MQFHKYLGPDALPQSLQSLGGLSFDKKPFFFTQKKKKWKKLNLTTDFLSFVYPCTSDEV